MKTNRIIYGLLAVLLLLAFLGWRHRPQATIATAEPPPLPSIVRPVLVAHSTVAERRVRRVKAKLPQAEAIARYEELEQETHGHGPSRPDENIPIFQRADATAEEYEGAFDEIERLKAEYEAASAPMREELQEHLNWLTEQIGEPAVTEYQRARGQRMFEYAMKVAAESDRELGIVRAPRNTNSLHEWMASGEILRVDGPPK